MILQGYSDSFYPSRCAVERKPVYQEGHYTGATKGGVREGKGRLVWTNGDTYTGDFHNGLRHGQGQLETKRGIRYEGDWRISRRHGEGSQEWPNGERYYGGWIHDLPDGRGTWLRRGGRYAGDLSEGLRHGKGILKFRNGAEYDGQWIRGRMHGYGSYLWPDARIYKGSWEAGLRHGEGTLSFSSGERRLSAEASWSRRFRLARPPLIASRTLPLVPMRLGLSADAFARHNRRLQSPEWIPVAIEELGDVKGTIVGNWGCFRASGRCCNPSVMFDILHQVYRAVEGGQETRAGRVAME
eukprot:jgi/Undpi1/6531/HiC_scaffold_20.g09010.m1